MIWIIFIKDCDAFSAVKRRSRDENGRKYYGGSRRPSSHVMPNGLQVTHVWTTTATTTTTSQQRSYEKQQKYLWRELFLVDFRTETLKRRFILNKNHVNEHLKLKKTWIMQVHFNQSIFYLSLILLIMPVSEWIISAVLFNL